ncbi:ATP-grasp domain-containing protein, partial [Mitsuokella sp.]|uniref:ATP-grasp domain-containing protein n=1 Tax=Mitsuokella sp. TaxID=2049034 RepID=UPI003D7D1B61
MNFIFISPHFPKHYWNFCDRLKKNGVNVLGIGDSPYDELSEELKNALTEYYYLPHLDDYDQMVRAVGFFTFKYGKIDWIESNNEFWLEQDARLRTDFHVTTGEQIENIGRIKNKSAMKAYYKKAGVPTARLHKVTSFEAGRDFAHMVGYPVIVKPDNGVGASDTYKLHTDDELAYFYATKHPIPYVMEEFVKGQIFSYDAILDSHSEPLFESMTAWPPSI